MCEKDKSCEDKCKKLTTDSGKSVFDTLYNDLEKADCLKFDYADYKKVNDGQQSGYNKYQNCLNSDFFFTTYAACQRDVGNDPHYVPVTSSTHNVGDAAHNLHWVDEDGNYHSFKDEYFKKKKAIVMLLFKS
jgi:hypothetical protein